MKTLFALFLFSALLLPIAVGAQLDSADRVRDAAQEAVREEVQEFRSDVRERTEDARERVRTEIKILRGEVRERFEVKREKAGEELERRKEEFRLRVEEERMEAKTRLEARRAEVREKAEQIRDERKKEITNRLYERINELNERLTDHFLSVLERMEGILDNVASRADKAEAHGLDVSSVRAAVNEAHNAIAAARTAVETQAGKVYSFDITTEENLQSDVGEARQALHNDLTAIKEVVRSAHNAVRNAAVTLAQIPRVDELEVETDEPEEEEEEDNTTE